MQYHLITAEAGGTATRGALLEVLHDEVRLVASSAAGSGNPNVAGPAARDS